MTKKKELRDFYIKSYILKTKMLQSMFPTSFSYHRTQ